MSDNQSDLAYQEVDDELRKERLHSFWSRYGKLVVSTAVGIVLVVAGREGYNAYTKSVELENAAQFETAVKKAEDLLNNPVDVWGEAAKNMTDGYATLARFRLAAVHLTEKKYADAITVYDEISKDSSVTESYQDLAQLLAAMSLMNDIEQRSDVRSRLEKLTGEGRTWAYSAREQLAMLDLLEGDREAAHKAFTELSTEADAPQSIQARARELSNTLRTPIAPAVTVAPVEAETHNSTEDAGSDK